MKITAVETIQLAEYSNLVWVERSDRAGRDLPQPRGHGRLPPRDLRALPPGKDPLQIECHARALMSEISNHFMGYPSRSVELRGNSGVDLALWDLFGKAAGLPLHQLLAASVRKESGSTTPAPAPPTIGNARAGADTLLVRTDELSGAADPEDDLRAQHERAAELAQSLLDEGTRAKIWPFDAYALPTGGQHIAAEDLGRAVRLIEAIREAVGDQIDVMIEYHGLWQLPAALQIADALEGLAIYWHEDPIAMHQQDGLARYKARVNGRVCGSENLGTKA